MDGLVGILELPVTYAAGVAGLAALVVAIRSPRWGAVERWGAALGEGDDDVRTSQVRGLLTRSSLVTLVVYAVVVLVSLVLQLKAVGPAWALGVAVVASAGVGVDGGRARRVDLLAAGAPMRPSWCVVSLAAWSGALAVVAVGLWWLVGDRLGWVGWVKTGPDTSMPDSERWLLPTTAACSVLTGLLLLAVVRRARLRRALPGAEPAVDAALRVVSTRRAALGAAAALVSLTAVLVAQAPLPWVVADPEAFDPAVGQAFGLATTALVGLAMAGLAVGLLRWRSTVAAAPAERSARVEV